MAARSRSSRERAKSGREVASGVGEFVGLRGESKREILTFRASKRSKEASSVVQARGDTMEVLCDSRHAGARGLDRGDVIVMFSVVVLHLAGASGLVAIALPRIPATTMLLRPITSFSDETEHVALNPQITGRNRAATTQATCFQVVWLPSLAHVATPESINVSGVGTVSPFTSVV